MDSIGHSGDLILAWRISVIKCTNTFSFNSSLCIVIYA
jgi:hypothetical protein